MDRKVKKEDKKVAELEAKLAELTNDLQRTRADFENYRKHVEHDLATARQLGQSETVKKLLPTLDIIDAALANVPAELADNDWAKGIMAMQKKLVKSLSDMGLAKMDAKPGDTFDHDRHDAIQMDEAEGETEVLSAILRPGYLYHGEVLRPAMVSVTRK